MTQTSAHVSSQNSELSAMDTSLTLLNSRHAALTSEVKVACSDVSIIRAFLQQTQSNEEQTAQQLVLAASATDLLSVSTNKIDGMQQQKHTLEQALNKRNHENTVAFIDTEVTHRCLNFILCSK